MLVTLTAPLPVLGGPIVPLAVLVTLIALVVTATQGIELLLL